jgi:hypothetical protein
LRELDLALLSPADLLVKAEAKVWCLLNLYDTHEMSVDELVFWTYDVHYWRQKAAQCAVILDKG